MCFLDFCSVWFDLHMMHAERPPLHKSSASLSDQGSPAHVSLAGAPARSSPSVTFTAPPPRLSNTTDAAADARAALAAIASGEAIQTTNDAWGFERRRDSAEALQMCQENVNW